MYLQILINVAMSDSLFVQVWRASWFGDIVLNFLIWQGYYTYLLVFVKDCINRTILEEKNNFAFLKLELHIEWEEWKVFWKTAAVLSDIRI